MVSQELRYNRGMKDLQSRLPEEAMSLPVEARAALAGSLLESLDETVDEDAEAEWAAEINRRVQDLDSGKAKLIPWSQTRRLIQGQ